MDNYSVYKHTFPDGKVYIGISINPKTRWSRGHGYKNNKIMDKELENLLDNYENAIYGQAFPITPSIHQLHLLLDYIANLEQQCKKQEEVINRIFNETKETRDIINNNRCDNILKHGSLINYLGIVEDLLKENQELKSQLKGTTHCFDEEEHEKLKKQLEELKEEKQEWINLLAMFKNQQKEFIKFLEDNYKETQDIWYIKILQKYKSIIGVSDENNMGK